MKRRRGERLFRWITIVPVLFLVGYVAANAAELFRDELKTVSAVEITIEDAIPADVFFVRDEYLLSYDAPGVIAPVPDGTRVAKGNIVARVYENYSALSGSYARRELTRRVTEMEAAQTQSASGMDIIHTDAGIFKQLAAMLDARDRRRMEDYDEAGLNFKASVFRREFTYGEGGDLNDALVGARGQLATLSATVSTELATIKAPAAGLFISEVDGFEEQLTVDSLENLTVQELLGLQRDATAAAGNYGKLSLGYTWYAAAILPESAEITGSKLTLRFADSAESVMTFNVERVGEPQDGKKLAILSTTYGLEDFAGLRRLPADNVTNTYTGLRVPKVAVKQDPRTLKYGVYCVVGTQAVFKPIEIIGERDNFYLAAFNPEKAGVNELLPGDVMLTSGKNLYDGKVIAK
ncbi:hypothetical protein FACS1894217_01260 [Clostridia bacterium]|nr:hypothetical protein FACS1894217_01260 [Clostridia bacterium]